MNLARRIARLEARIAELHARAELASRPMLVCYGDPPGGWTCIHSDSSVHEGTGPHPCYGAAVKLDGSGAPLSVL